MMNGILLISNNKKEFEKKYDKIININDKNYKTEVKKCNQVDIFIDLENINLDKKITSKYIKKIKAIEKYSLKDKIKFKVLNSYNINECKNEFEAYLLISALSTEIDNIPDRIDFLYDKICEFLDYQFSSKNLCDFKNDVCFAKREYGEKMGCCHHYSNVFTGLLIGSKLNLCEYQKNKSCQAKCLTCKMFVCDPIIKKGIKFTNNNVLIIKYYFNIVQKIIIKVCFFTEKEKILRRLKRFAY